jgi:hypothetical protein
MALTARMVTVDSPSPRSSATFLVQRTGYEPNRRFAGGFRALDPVPGHGVSPGPSRGYADRSATVLTDDEDNGFRVSGAHG